MSTTTASETEQELLSLFLRISKDRNLCAKFAGYVWGKADGERISPDLAKTSLEVIRDFVNNYREEIEAIQP